MFDSVFDTLYGALAKTPSVASITSECFFIFSLKICLRRVKICVDIGIKLDQSKLKNVN